MTQESAETIARLMEAADEDTRVVVLFGALVHDAESADLAIGAAHRCGLNAALCCEAILQSFLFAGFPRCINGLESFRRYYGEDVCRGTVNETTCDDLESRRSRGRALFARVYSQHTETVLDALDRYHGDLRDWILVDAYGKILSRPGMSPKLRELCAVAGLLVSGDVRQLSSHIRGSLNCGASAAEIEQAMTTASGFYPLDRLTLGRSILEKISGS